MARVFPGIDPYLEDREYWSDFHLRVIILCAEVIEGCLPDHYEARADDPRQLLPDVAVIRGDELRITSGSAVGTATESVTILITPLEEARRAFIEIFRMGDESELVAVVEVLSLTNKARAGRLEYLSKRNALLKESVHLIELDFLIRGIRLPMREPLPPTDY